jgi:23S rRNA (guanosine2251-2'-O)-methyltransferase
MSRSGRVPPRRSAPPRKRAAAGEQFVVTGRRPALEAVRSGLAREILIADKARQTEGLRSLLSEAERAGVTARRVPSQTVERLVPGENQGVVAMVEPPQLLDEGALSSMPFGPHPVAVVLDGITDPRNLGACARAAEAAGAAVMVIRERRGSPVTPAAMKASAGALLHLPVARVPNLTRALSRLRDRGFTSVGLDHAGSDLWNVEPPGPIVLVVGAEGSGLSRLVRERCDVLVSIPMRGRTESLNAATALAVGLFAFALRPEGAATMPREAGVAQSGSASDL